MKYIFYSLIILLVFTSCSRKPISQPKPTQYSKKTSPVKTDPYKSTAQRSSSTLAKLYTQHKKWRGTPYRYGGLTLSGVDCSGFIFQTYRSLFNIKLPRSTKEQVKQGKRVYINQLTAGDLLFFKTGHNVRHVGIYLERGKFLHASSSKGVMISSMYMRYWKDSYWQAKRIL